MMNEYSRCELGKRCIFKTNDTFMFRKYTLLVAISNAKCIGWTMFEKGAMNKERLVEFMKEYIFRKYKDHLIVMDNAGGHRNNYVWNAITESGNQYLHSVPYTPITNPSISSEPYFIYISSSKFRYRLCRGYILCKNHLKNISYIIGYRQTDYHKIDLIKRIKCRSIIYHILLL